MDIDQDLYVLVLLMNQSEIPVLHQLFHQDLASYHAVRLQLALAQSIYHSLEILSLITQYCLVGCFSEHQPRVGDVLANIPDMIVSAVG